MLEYSDLHIPVLGTSETNVVLTTQLAIAAGHRISSVHGIPLTGLSGYSTTPILRRISSAHGLQPFGVPDCENHPNRISVCVSRGRPPYIILMHPDQHRSWYPIMRVVAPPSTQSQWYAGAPIKVRGSTPIIIGHGNLLSSGRGCLYCELISSSQSERAYVSVAKGPLALF